MDWSPQQEGALRDIRAWLKNPRGPQVLRVFGFAGTGKTTLAREVQNMVGKVVYCAFTGKASLVLGRKGCTDAATIHSTIYRVKENTQTGYKDFVLNSDSPVKYADVVVIDEVSMVGEELGLDLLSFGTKVLVLGDPFQLPPIKGEGFFTAQEPDIMLTEIHRQAADNPIIRMSMDVREGRPLDLGDYGDSKVILRSRLGQKMVTEADQLLCGMNKTRKMSNYKLRQLNGLGLESEFPVKGDRLVCLKNNRVKGLLNGSLWTVAKSARARDDMDMRISSLDSPDTAIPVDVLTPIQYFKGTQNDLPWHVRRFADEFDFGYALTVHKAQGSQWDDVILMDESGSFRENRLNHLYTGITRAAERVTVVVDR